MNLLPQYKIGNCNCGCGGKDVEGRKVGKNFYCVYSYNTMKTKEQVKKANERNSVRSLRGKQKEMGNEGAADRANLVADLDYVFSRIVRLRGIDAYGNCECYTCGSRKHWSLMQCGHYVKRGNMSLRFDFKNSRIQCKHCNETLHGNYEVYKQRLEEEQKGLSEQLEEQGREVFKYSIDELKQLLIDLRGKLKPLEPKPISK